MKPVNASGKPRSDSERPDTWDVIVIGSGMGGSAFVSRFVGSGLRILVLERGGFLKSEEENWSPVEVLERGRYESEIEWETEEGRKFHPRVYFNVGGNSKFFGGSAFRLRESDFKRRELQEGATPAWPISYKELEPWYDEAEKAMKVHGQAGIDPSEPTRNPYPYQAIEHEPAIARLAAKMSDLGLHPFPLPVAIDQGPGGRCRKGSPCDGFPCRIRAKGDAETAFLRPTIKADSNITLLTNTLINRLVHDEEGRRIVEASGIGKNGEAVSFRGRVFVLAAGAVESAVLLLRSKSLIYPRGLANGSGLIGRNFMAHNNTVLMAFTPLRANKTRFQKTLALNDFYHTGHPACPTATGNIQTRGKIVSENLISHPSFLVRLFRRYIARHSLDFWIMSEDAPSNENRIEVDEYGNLKLYRRAGNLLPHNALVRHFRRILHRCGLPIVLVQKPRLTAVQHQCGTMRFGTEPDNSVLDKNCRSHQIENLYACDASVFPSSASVNPALTIAANAMRVGDIVLREIKHRR